MSKNLKEILTLPDSWKEDLNTKLREPSINNEYEDWKLERNFGTEIDVFALSFNAAGKARFRIFNDKTDEDKPQKLIPNPYPGIGADKAMIRYDLETTMKAAADAKFDNFGFTFDTTQKLRHAYYSIHSNEKTLKEAAIEDLTNFKFIFSAEDVQSLETNECLVLSYFGEIGAKLELSYSDAFTGTISALSKYLPAGEGLKIKSEAGAGIAFNIKVKDDFYSLIRKNSDGLFEITINKNASREAGLTAEAKINVEFEDKESLKALQTALLDALFQEKVEELDGLVDNQLEKLSDFQKEMLTFIGGKAGINLNFNQPDLVKEQYNTLKETIVEEVTDILKNKLEAGYTFEYKRVTRTNTLFEATATEDAIKKHLRNIVMFKPSALEDAEGVDITRYMLEKTTTISSRLGFALTFGDFKYAWEKLKTLKEEVSEDKLNNTRDISVSFINKHSYKSKNDRKWSVALNAELKTPEVYPKMNHFNFDFTLHWEDRQKKTKADELIEFVNMATIWKCIPENNFEKVLKEIGEATVNKENVKYSCHLHVPAGDMDSLFRPLAAADKNLIANTLSESMPYLDYNFRKSPSLRRIAYNSIWQDYLTEKPVPYEIRRYAGICKNHIRNFDPDLALWEGQFKTRSLPRDVNEVNSFVGLIEFFYIYQILFNIQRGARNLNRLAEDKQAYSLRRIRKNFNLLDDALSSKAGNDVYFNLNFMARLMLNVAAESGLTESVETVASVEYPKGDSTGKLIYSV